MGKKLKWINGDDFMGANQIEVYTCDYHGKCKRKPFAEVFPLKKVITQRGGKRFPGGQVLLYEVTRWELDGSKGWSYLCLYHFILEKLRRRKFAWAKSKEGT